MTALEKFRVMMKFETDGLAKSDSEIEKIVMVLTPDEALTQACDLVKTENPEMNYIKIWSCCIEMRYY